MLSVRSASINFKTQSESRSNWKERSSAPPQRTETHSDKGTSNYGPLNAQLAPRGVDVRYWPVNYGDPDESAHPVVNSRLAFPLSVRIVETRDSKRYRKVELLIAEQLAWMPGLMGGLLIGRAQARSPSVSC